MWGSDKGGHIWADRFTLLIGLTPCGVSKTCQNCEQNEEDVRYSCAENEVIVSFLGKEITSNYIIRNWSLELTLGPS